MFREAAEAHCSGLPLITPLRLTAGVFIGLVGWSYHVEVAVIARTAFTLLAEWSWDGPDCSCFGGEERLKNAQIRNIDRLDCPGIASRSTQNVFVNRSPQPNRVAAATIEYP
jgi:hypothetical protein